MSPSTFQDWQKRMGWTAAEVARRLGKSTDTISTYRLRGVTAREAKVVGLAMAALEHRLEPVS